MKKGQSPFERQLAFVGKRLNKTQKAFASVQSSLAASDIQAAYENAFILAGASEKLTLATRFLPAYTGHPEAHRRIEGNIRDSIPVKVGFTKEGWFGVYIPALLPKKSKGSVDYIRHALYLVMGQFFRDKQPVRYTDCVVVFRHIYRRDRPERHYRDHDNIEVNAVIDVIALYVLYDDSALQCSHFYCSAAGDDDRTEVFVVPRDEFIQWMLVSKNNKDKEIALYEKRF